MPTQEPCNEIKAIALKALHSSNENAKSIVGISAELKAHSDLCIVKHAQVQSNFKNIQWWHRTIAIGIVAILLGVIGEFLYLYVLTT